MLSPSQLAGIRRAIADAGVDGWLLYDFHGINPIAAGVVGISGMVTRRYFCYIPREGNPVAITHAIEQGPWEEWPADWPKRVYSSWRDFERYLADAVRGRKVAMEYSAGDAVPYLDRVPAGVVEMVRSAGAEVVTSADLVTRIYAVWTPEDLASHKRAAEHLARIARNAMALAGERARSGKPISEYELMMLIREEFSEANLVTDSHGPNVSVGLNAANPHYDPTKEHSALIRDGDILLIDLWAHEPDGVFADQTWMGSLGPASAENIVIWEAVRGARDAAIKVLRDRVESGKPVTGGEADDAARHYITERGFGEKFTHRTGHSIDSREIHGSGPNIDNLETRDVRTLLPGIAFSIEPGIYITGQVGMRTEVNGFIEDGSLLITPTNIQKDLFIV
ncbi:MAG TPA: Xaa-Pro peptidase family protein [Gemmatimonadaceae bacterium]